MPAGVREMLNVGSTSRPKQDFFGIGFSKFDGLDDAMHVIEAADPAAIDEFRYVVTPNADHIVRMTDRPGLLDIYNKAWLCLNDSRIVQLLLRLGGFDLPVIRGSDLVARMLGSQWLRGKRIVVVGGDETLHRWLQCLTAPETIFHYNPPMGFISTRNGLENVVDFIEQHLPAFVFLAVGSPNQEIVADACARKGLRGGVAFCVGAGILMAAGIEKRAPAFMRFVGLEWLYRLAQDPRRLAGRYFRDFRIFRLAAHEIIRERSLPPYGQ
jgi:N-acetylglucosaminyldiphosphoundecaprenol N-acetyl-beta-D-mannosaminyltransferase